MAQGHSPVTAAAGDGTPDATFPDVPWLLVRGLRFAYGPDQRPVVDIDELEIEPGSLVAITGPSGSGKTSLLYLLTGVEPTQAGTVRWGDVDLAGLREADRDRWRRRQIGFVFQDFHLLPGLSVEGNVLASCYFDQLRPTPTQAARARALLDSFGVPAGRSNVTTLSRGEQQRVAVARALLRDPPILVADEPTASLDATSGERIIGLLCEAVRARGATFLTVTHDPRLIDVSDSAYRLEGGRATRLR
jgi:putative ABC transport system ATP-binding protein